MSEAACCKPGCKGKVIGVCLELAANGDMVELPFCQEHVSDLRIDYFLPNPMEVLVLPSDITYEECRLHKVLFLSEQGEYFIVLESTETNSVFVMQTGYVEACSVYGATRKNVHPSPYTYQLMANLVRTLGGSIVEAVFDGYNKDFRSYESHLVLRNGNSIMKVKCRGSDAVGISFLAKTLIKVNSAFLGRVTKNKGE